jgi:prolyl oligopeptidase
MFHPPTPKYVAVSLSKGGSESGDVHVYDVSSGQETARPVPGVNGGTAGGSVAWNADGSGFYYTRYPRAGERPEADLHFFQQVYFHRLGADTKQDANIRSARSFRASLRFNSRLPRTGAIFWLSMGYGDGGEFAHYLIGPDGQWHQIARLSDEISRGLRRGRLFISALAFERP